MLWRAWKSGFLIILAFCSFEKISSYPQRIQQNAEGSATLHAAMNQTGPATKTATKLTDSYLPPTMQAIAHYIELLQYEPLLATTVEPPFTLSSAPVTLPTFSTSTISSTVKPPTKQPTITWWSESVQTSSKPTTWSTPTSWVNPSTIKPPVTWWSPPSTTTTKPTVWWSPPSTTPQPIWQGPSSKPSSSLGTTRLPWGSTTTPAWWHLETTPLHKPGYFAPNRESESDAADVGLKPSKKPQMGDLSLLSISSFPHFEYFLQPNTKHFQRKPEYEYLHLFPAELLQDIESEPYDVTKGSDQERINEFRRVYDDSFTRVRLFSPVSGKKRVPPTRPYVLFLIIYDLYKREAKRLALQEFTGYSPSMIERLHEISKYSAERQLYTLMDGLLAQKSIVAMDVLNRMNEIMTDLANPNSVTAKALHVLPALKFEF